MSYQNNFQPMRSEGQAPRVRLTKLPDDLPEGNLLRMFTLIAMGASIAEAADLIGKARASAAIMVRQRARGFALAELRKAVSREELTSAREIAEFIDREFEVTTKYKLRSNRRAA